MTKARTRKLPPRAFRGSLYDKMIFAEKSIEEYSLDDLQNLVTVLQLELAHMYTFQRPTSRCIPEPRCGSGIQREVGR